MRKHLKGFIAGIFTAVVLLTLMGAARLDAGKYQPMTIQGFPGLVIAILDTETGIVHMHTTSGSSRIFTTFDLVKGEVGNK